MNTRWHWLVGVTLAVSLVACGDSDEPDKDKQASGGTSSKGAGGKGSGGKGVGGSDSGGNGGTTSDGSGGGSGGSAGGGAGAGGTPTPSTFACSGLGAVALDASDRKCYDFSNSGDATAFTPQGGTWTIVNGGYVGRGPAKAVTCPETEGSKMTASTLSGFAAADVRVHAKMTSLTLADKVIVLRERGPGNRLEVNFRAGFVYDGQAGGDDMVIQELVDCQYSRHVQPGVVKIPHVELQAITVDVELRGQQIKVTVDDKVVYDHKVSDTVDVATAPGSVGFGVFYTGVQMFDDFVVETLK